MTYRYRYTGDQNITLPTLGINTEGKDKDFVYETTEPINHPDFVLASEQPAEEPHQEIPEQPQAPVVAEAPQVEEVPVENVSQQEGTQVQ